MEKLKVLIAEKDIYSRKRLTEAVDGTDFGMVVHACSSETIALDWLEHRPMDVLLLDAYFLKTGGMSVLKKMTGKYPELRIVVTGTNDPADAAAAMDALKLGAMDVLLKPSSAAGLDGVKGFLQALFAQMMITKVSQEAASEAISGSARQRSESAGVPLKQMTSSPAGFDLLLIASSTGGPRALESVLTELPAEFSKPVLAVQHMPADFTRVLAQALDKKCSIRVKEAENGDMVRPGKVYIAPGGKHMILTHPPGSPLTVRLDHSPPENGVRPSADVLFRSVAQTCRGMRILAVILTGMGNDGTRGLMELKQKCDCYCITQSEKSCIVYGMPKSVYDAGLSDESADLGGIAKRIMQIDIDGG